MEPSQKTQQGLGWSQTDLQKMIQKEPNIWEWAGLKCKVPTIHIYKIFNLKIQRTHNIKH